MSDPKPPERSDRALTKFMYKFRERLNANDRRIQRFLATLGISLLIAFVIFLLVFPKSITLAERLAKEQAPTVLVCVRTEEPTTDVSVRLSYVAYSQYDFRDDKELPADLVDGGRYCLPVPVRPFPTIYDFRNPVYVRLAPELEVVAHIGGQVVTTEVPRSAEGKFLFVIATTQQTPILTVDAAPPGDLLPTKGETP